MSADPTPGPRTGPRAGRRRWLVGALVLVVALAAAVWWVVGRGPSGPYAEALGVLPEDTLRSNFTDWSRVAQAVDVPEARQVRDPEVVRTFLDELYDADIATGSAQLDVVEGLAAVFGYSAADLEWEVYGQAPDGSVDVVRLSDDVDLDEVADNLDEAGYDAPEDDDGVWSGSADLVAQFDTPMTGLQINVMVLRDERLVLTSDSGTYLEEVRDVVRGDAPSLREVSGTDDLAATVPEAVSAQLWSRDFACDDLAMSSADAADQNEAARLVERAGGVNPLAGMLMARLEGDGAVIAMWYDSDAVADDDLQPRADLARGAAPGQGGDFTERFTVEEATVEGRLVTIRVTAEPGSFMGDLGQGPVLFAAC